LKISPALSRIRIFELLNKAATVFYCMAFSGHGKSGGSAARLSEVGKAEAAES
jgi:hypothetical protein